MGPSSQKPKIFFFENSKRNEGFSFKVRFIFTFLQGSLNPKNMSLLPKSLKIITSAPQLPENKGSFSPDPKNPWGPRLYKLHANHTSNSDFDRTFLPYLGYFLHSTEERVGNHIKLTGSRIARSKL